MMPLPAVAIVGRPNVGKSSLFNRICRRRTAIVDPAAGVTRDRVTEICETGGRYFELIDTGGHGVVDRDDLSEHVERQIEFAISQANLVLFVVDAREGLTPLDVATAELLRTRRTKVRLIANKVDEPHMESALGDFFKLGFGDPLAVSALNGNGRTALMELIGQAVSGAETEAPDEAVMRIALVGRRNVGKSTFINALAGQERVIVSETPGTTRDSIDVRFEKDGRALIAIDTAGLRKKSRIADSVEFYAYSRAVQSIRRADVVLFLVDAAAPVGRVDKVLAHLIASEYKPCILVVNKWDQAKGRALPEQYGEYLTKTLPEIDYAPLAFTSATEGRNMDSTIDLAAVLFKQSHLRVGTGRLNQILNEAVSVNASRSGLGRKRPRFYFATQVSTSPPTVVVFVNACALVSPAYRRFLLNRFRESLPFSEIPIRLIFKARRSAILKGGGHEH